MGGWTDDSVCSVVHNGRLYIVLDTMVMSGEYVCCSVVFGTLFGVWVQCYVVRVADDICYLLSSMVISVRLLESGVSVHTSG